MSELERIIHDNSNGLDYILVGEIYLPLIAVPEEKREIGFYGSLHRNYLKDYKSGLYSYLTLSGKLWTYLADLNEQCLERRDFLMEQIMEQEGITKLVVMFFTWLSATVFHILSGIICITAVLGYGFGQETGTEAVRMLVAGFILYILPVLSGWAVVWLETFKIRLME